MCRRDVDCVYLCSVKTLITTSFPRTHVVKMALLTTAKKCDHLWDKGIYYKYTMSSWMKISQCSFLMHAHIYKQNRMEGGGEGKRENPPPPPKDSEDEIIEGV